MQLGELMHTVLLYLLAWLGSAVLGVVSGLIVFSIAWLLNRRYGVRLETCVGLAGIIGFAMTGFGSANDYPWIAASGVLLWGWVNLVLLGLLGLLIWKIASLFIGLLRRRRFTRSD